MSQLGRSPSGEESGQMSDYGCDVPDVFGGGGAGPTFGISEALFESAMRRAVFEGTVAEWPSKPT